MPRTMQTTRRTFGGAKRRSRNNRGTRLSYQNGLQSSREYFSQRFFVSTGAFFFFVILSNPIDVYVSNLYGFHYPLHLNLRFGEFYHKSELVPQNRRCEGMIGMVIPEGPIFVHMNLARWDSSNTVIRDSKENCKIFSSRVFLGLL